MILFPERFFIRFTRKTKIKSSASCGARGAGTAVTSRRKSMLITKTNTFIIRPVATLLGFIMNAIFIFLSSVFHVENIGLCIILFTIIIYGVMTPLTYKQQKFSKLSRENESGTAEDPEEIQGQAGPGFHDEDERGNQGSITQNTAYPPQEAVFRC